MLLWDQVPASLNSTNCNLEELLVYQSDGHTHNQPFPYSLSEFCVKLKYFSPFTMPCPRPINAKNKKVLVRELKRQTDRSVSSTPSVTQGGLPPAGVPPARSDRGVSPQGYSPWPGLTGGYPRWGTPWPGLTGGTRGRVPPAWIVNLYPR